jgi:hypothetical protein
VEPAAQPRVPAVLAACGLGAVAVGAIAVMLVLGLGRPSPGALMTVRPEPTVVKAAAKQAPTARTADAAAGRLFAATSFWNRPLKDGAAIDPASASLVAAFAAEIDRERQSGIGPWIATAQGSTPLYRVARSQRRVHVALDTAGAPALQRAFKAVPIPDGAKPAGGPDRHLTVWQPSTDTLWEFFAARREGGAWHARWGGAIRRVSKSRGYYSTAAWPGATPFWGASASSLPVVGGTILLDDLRRGRIDHALAINLPAGRADTFAWPAQRTDGTGPPSVLPEGARLRLDPKLDLSRLRLPRLTRMIAEAVQRHGIVVRDQTHHGTTLLAEDPTRLGSNRYSRYFAGKTPAELLARFPWDRLQVLRMRLCTRAPCRPD